jgi:pimeloyl-ACP methyl ester carboxylesterase
MGEVKKVCSVLLALAITLALLPGTAVGASKKWRTDRKTIAGFDVEATPDELDIVTIERHWFGGEKPADPKAVLIMVPGFFGGAGNFRYVGRRLVERKHGLQVWALDRRSNALENRCGMERAEDSKSYPGLSGLGIYYLQGTLPLGDCPIPEDDLDPTTWQDLDTEYFPEQEEAGSIGMADWALETTLGDVRAVVRRAHKLYPDAKVVLGGHSLGGMTSQAYAGWRFGSRRKSAGWRDIDGMVLIDGAMRGNHWVDELLPQHFEREQELADGTFYWERADAGYLLGYLAEIGGMATSFGSELESFLWTSLKGTPLEWPDPTTCPTNKAVFAALTDDQYAFSQTFEMHQGTLASPVDLDANGIDDVCKSPNQDRLLAHWTDFDQVGELSSTDRWARLTWQGSGPNFVEWFFPIAMNSQMDLAHNLDSKATYFDEISQTETTAAESKGHRVFDTARVAVPTYAFVAAFCTEPFEWYSTVATNLPSYWIVDHSGEDCETPASVPYSHLDPILAEDRGGHTNGFVVTLLDWLEQEVL